MRKGQWVGVLSGLVLAACGGTEDGSDGGKLDGATFDAVRTQVFLSCNGAQCHASAVDDLGDVVIREEDAYADQVYANLVDAPVANVPGRAAPSVSKRVVPGDPKASFLYWKILGHDPDDMNANVVGLAMPPTCGRPPCLPQEQIELVRRWIAAGAPR